MSDGTSSNRFPAPQHDHSGCIAQAMDTADKLCSERGLRFTRLRRRVLELVWNSHRPVGAYEVLDSLASDGKKAAPPTVYRALDFLIDAGLVHRLDSLNAYVGCPDPDEAHTGQFLICRKCRSVAELDDAEINSLIADKAAAQGFTAVYQMLEIQGLCPECRDN